MQIYFLACLQLLCQHGDRGYIYFVNKKYVFLVRSFYKLTGVNKNSIEIIAFGFRPALINLKILNI